MPQTHAMTLEEELETVRQLAERDRREARAALDEIAERWPIPLMNEKEKNDFSGTEFEVLWEDSCLMAGAGSGIPDPRHPDNEAAASDALASMVGSPDAADTYQPGSKRRFCAETFYRTRRSAENARRKGKRYEVILVRYEAKNVGGYLQNSKRVFENFPASVREALSAKTLSPEIQEDLVKESVLATTDEFPGIRAAGMIHLENYGYACFEGEGSNYSETAERLGWTTKEYDSYKSWLHNNPEKKDFFEKNLVQRTFENLKRL